MPANDVRTEARDWSLLGLLSIFLNGTFFFNGVVLPPLALVLEWFRHPSV